MEQRQVHKRTKWVFGVVLSALALAIVVCALCRSLFEREVVLVDCLPPKGDLAVSAAVVYYASESDPRFSERQKCKQEVDADVLRRNQAQGNRNHVLVEVPCDATECRFDLWFDRSVPATMPIEFFTREGEKTYEMKMFPGRQQTVTVMLAADEFRQIRFFGLHFFGFSTIVFLCALAGGLFVANGCKMPPSLGKYLSVPFGARPRMQDAVMEQKLAPKRSVWVDLAKMLAILSVLLDHTNRILYRDQSIAFASYFGVSLFIFVMGVTSSWSLLRGKVWNLRERCWRIGGPYLMATLVFCILRGGAIDFEVYLAHVVRFNAAGPFYYVLMYLEFLFVIPILSLFTRCSGWRGVALEFAGLGTCLALAWFTTLHTNVLHVYGGGGKILGGTFLVFLYLGIWFGKYCRNIRLGVVSSCVALLIFCAGTVAWWRFVSQDRLHLDACFPYGRGFNPPSFSLFLYGCLVAGLVFSLGTLLDNCFKNRMTWLLGGVTWLGRHTLYVFLYHVFWLDILKRMPSISGMGHTWLKWVIYFSVMILGSLLFEVVFKWLYHVVVMAYRTRQASVEERN